MTPRDRNHEINRRADEKLQTFLIMTSFVDNKFIVSRLSCQDGFFPPLKHKFVIQLYTPPVTFESFVHDPEKAFREYQLGKKSSSEVPDKVQDVAKIDGLTIERMETHFYSHKYRIKETGDIFYSWHSDISLAYQENYKNLQPSNQAVGTFGNFGAFRVPSGIEPMDTTD